MHSRIRGTAPLGEHSSFIDLAVTYSSILNGQHTHIFQPSLSSLWTTLFNYFERQKNFVENSCKQSYRHYVTFYLNTSYYYSKTTKFLLAIFCLFTVFDFSVIYMYQYNVPLCGWLHWFSELEKDAILFIINQIYKCNARQECFDNISCLEQNKPISAPMKEANL